MDFGLYLPCYWPDPARSWDAMYPEMLDQARLGEELGFSSLTIPEHHFMNYLTHPSALLTAVKVAAVTENLPIVTSVLVLPLSDIRVLAGQICQTDHLTDGRLQIGVGRGAFRYEFDRLDSDLTQSREIFDESLEILELLLTQENVGYEGEHYRFEPLTITPRPLQKPHPPIWIAALHPDAIAACVERGYHIQTTPLRDPFEAAKQQAAGFYRGRAKAGKNCEDKKLSLLRHLYVAESETDKAEKIAIAHTNQRRFSNVRRTPGTIDRGFIDPIEVPETLNDVERSSIIGSAEEVMEKLQSYATLGIHELVCHMAFGAEQQDVLASMRRFHREVMPAFAGCKVEVPDPEVFLPAGDQALRDMPFGGGIGSLERAKEPRS